MNNLHDKEPVCFCKKCLSLAIKVEEDMEYCDTCGADEISELPVEKWGKLFYDKYGQKYLDMPNKMFKEMVK